VIDGRGITLMLLNIATLFLSAMICAACKHNSQSHKELMHHADDELVATPVSSIEPSATATSNEPAPLSFKVEDEADSSVWIADGRSMVLPGGRRRGPVSMSQFWSDRPFGLCRATCEGR
jgi:hypothetical protein